MSRLHRILAILALLVAAGAITTAPALARKPDRDRLPDRWEKRHHLNLKKDDSRRDRDRDGLSNYGEYRSHTNPRKKDSDRDGRRDAREDFDRDRLRNGAEIRTGFDPGDADSDNDGTKDGRENAGRIVKLSDRSITIKLAAGGSLTAGLGDALAARCPGSSDGGAEAGDEAPDPDEDAEDAPESGEDAEPADEPIGDEDPGDTVDEPDSMMARAGGPDDEFDDAAFDQGFEAGADVACSKPRLKVGAIVHKARVKRTGTGRVLVSIALLAKKKK
jgi:hypothetical protein